MATFREQYEKLPPGNARENLVYQYAIQQGKPNTIPITVDGPGGTKITYKVMPDFLTIEGIRVTLTPPTAQKIAKYFNMQLPTAKMADQIYRNSNKIPAKPLSGSGVTIDGKRYSGKDVVDKLISNPKANIAYNDVINEQLKNKELDPNKPIDGFAKTLVQSEDPNRTAFYGLWTNPNDPKAKPLQGGSGVSSHDLNQTEYCSMARLVDDNVIVTKPDGTKINTSLDKFLKTNELSKAISFSPAKGVQTYQGTTKSNKVGPPAGYRSAKLDSESRPEAESISKGLLNKPMWYETVIRLSNGKEYLAKLEPHSNAPKGVSLYERVDQSQPSPISNKQNVIPDRKPQISQPIKQDKSNLFGKLDNFLKSLETMF